VKQKAIAIGVLLVMLSMTLSASAPTASAQTVPTWTLMVYMDYDNSLSSYIVSDTNEIRTGIQNGDGSVQAIVLQDGSGSGANLLLIEKTGDTTLNLADYGIDAEPNMGSPLTLITFVNNVMESHPSEHYFLDMGNHGMAFVASLADDTSQDYMTLSELDYSMDRFNKHIDIMGFDCCLMQELSVAYALSKHCDYIVASEDYEPGDGWDYTFLGNLTSASTAEDVVRSVIDYFYAFYGTSRDNTLSAIDTRALAMVVDDLSIASQYLATKMGTHHLDVKMAVSTSFKITSQIKELLDMKQFITNVESQIIDTTSSLYLNRLLASIDQAIFYEKSSVASEQGLSVYFPNRDATLSEAYLGSDLSKDTYYDEWMLSYLSDSPVDSLFQLIPSAVITKLPDVVKCELPEGYDGGYVEARVDNGDWFSGGRDVSTDPHYLVTRVFYQGEYSDVNSDTISGVTRVETEVTKTVYSIQLSAGTNFITFPNSYIATAHDLLDLVSGDSITEKTTEGYRTYVYDVKNEADNFAITPGKGYFLSTTTPYTLTFEEVAVEVETNLDVGWNAVGITRAGTITASALASEIEGDNVLVKSVGGNGYITYIEGVGGSDFTLSQGDGLYIYSSMYTGKVVI